MDNQTLYETYDEALKKGLSDEEAIEEVLKWAGEDYVEEGGWLGDKINEAISRKYTLNTLKTNKFSYEDIPKRKEVSTIVLEPFLDLVNQKEEGFLNYEIRSRLYKAQMGVGWSPFYILVPTGVNLPCGEAKLCLRRLSSIEAKRKLVDGLEIAEMEKLVHDIENNKRWKMTECNDKGIWYKSGKLDLTKSIEDQCIEFGDFIDGHIYEPVDIVHKDFVRLSLEKFGFEKVLSDFLDENYTHDPDFLYLARACLVDFGNSTCPKLMRYQPHMLLQTNTKIGKSHLFEKICGELKFDRASAANLLGFSGGKMGEVKEGTLNNQHKCSCWDDLEKNFGEGIVDDLPTLLEQGEAKIRKGIQNLTTRYSGQVVITSNTKGENLDVDDMAIQLMEMVKRLSSNPERFGSRLGFIVFMDNWKPARMNTFHLSDKDIRLNERILRLVFERICHLAERLIENREVQGFLESEDKEFSAEVAKKADEASLDKSTKDLLISFREGFKHQKGLAYKEGLITFFVENNDEAIQLMESESYTPDIDKVLEICRSEWQNIKQLQIRMISKFICGARQKEFHVDEIPKYLRCLLIGLGGWLRIHKLKTTRMVVFGEVGDYLHKEGTYKDVGTICSIFPKNFERLNRLIYDLEVTIIKKDGSLCFKVGPETGRVFEEHGLEDRLIGSIIRDTTIPMTPNEKPMDSQ